MQPGGQIDALALIAEIAVSGVLGLRVYVRPDGGEVRIGKYGWQALGEGVQNKDGVRTRYHNRLRVRITYRSLIQGDGDGRRYTHRHGFHNLMAE